MTEQFRQVIPSIHDIYQRPNDGKWLSSTDLKDSYWTFAKEEDRTDIVQLAKTSTQLFVHML